MDRILEACKQTGAQAVHPGYGFLSENEKFAKLLEDNGITFIGPPSTAIRAMGDKIESKKIAQAAKVNIIPGKLADVHDINEVLQIGSHFSLLSCFMRVHNHLANEIGYPVMIKASAGGGGKGMRIAWNDEEAREGFTLAKQEAKASFGDDRILIEKYIDNPRHIEIQLLGDGQGNTLYLNERECSIQRRNQKVLEEAPSSFVDPATRKAMGEQAVALANAVGYKSAGTVEFLMDSKKNFYFLEMNTRLQVEHPVTEYITGLDLVEWMIRVAAGQKITFKQDEVKLNGWATEARVYAEDPIRGFLPSIGTLTRYREPPEGDTVRVETGVREGDEISIHYDPLISKLVAYGPNREESINELKRMLDKYVIRGVGHNVCFLRSVLEHPRYVSGDISTKFIPEEYPNGFHGHELTPSQEFQLIVAAGCIQTLKVLRDSSITGQLAPPKEDPEWVDKEWFDELWVETFAVGFQGKEYDVRVHWTSRGYPHEVEVESESGTKLYHVNCESFGDVFELAISELVEGNADEDAVVVGDKETLTIQVEKEIPSGYRLIHVGSPFDVLVRPPRVAKLESIMPKKEVVDSTKFLTSPMPGKIINVNIKDGQKVVIGQPLIIMEAMKMQNVLRAIRDCVVKSVKVKEGTNVSVDEILVEFE